MVSNGVVWGVRYADGEIMRRFLPAADKRIAERLDGTK